MPRVHKSKKQRRLTEYGFSVIYERLLEGGYHVLVPSLPGLITYGRTFTEARAMAKDAISCHIQGLLKDHREVPRESASKYKPVVERLKVMV